MDLNVILDEMRDLTEELRGSIDSSCDEDGPGFSQDDLERADALVSHVQNLDKHVMSMGMLPDEWTARCAGGLLKRAELAREVYKEAIEASETFEGPFGTQLAYLFGAILEDKKITLDMTDDENIEVYCLLTDIFPMNHDVWNYIQKEEPVERTG